MWNEHKLKITFNEWVVGGIPRNDELVGTWLSSRKASEARLTKLKEEGPVATLEELEKDVRDKVDMVTETEAVWTGFKKDDNGLYLQPYQIKAHLKDSARVLSAKGDKESGKPVIQIQAFRSKMADRVYIGPPIIYLTRDGKYLEKPDGYWEHPVHVVTPRGPRSALKRNDYVEYAEMQLVIKVLGDGMITRSHLDMMLEYGSVHGMMAERGLGHGQYEWEWLS